MHPPYSFEFISQAPPPA